MFFCNWEKLDIKRYEISRHKEFIFVEKKHLFKIIKYNNVWNNIIISH